MVAGEEKGGNTVFFTLVKRHFMCKKTQRKTEAMNIIQTCCNSTG